MTQLNEKITITVSPELYRLLELESTRRDLGIATLCRHLITKSIKHSYAGNLSLNHLIRLNGDDGQE